MFDTVTTGFSVGDRLSWAPSINMPPQRRMVSLTPALTHASRFHLAASCRIDEFIRSLPAARAPAYADAPTRRSAGAPGDASPWPAGFPLYSGPDGKTGKMFLSAL